MPKYEVMIDAKRGYRFIVDANDPDLAYEKAQERYVNDGDDGEEGGYEEVVDISCSLIEEETIEPSTTTGR